MKLSEAIRTGSARRHEDLNGRGRHGRHIVGVATDVLGAAVAGADLEYKDIYEVLYDRWPDFGLQPLRCPECGGHDDGFDMLLHLNHDHKWSREKVAQFVEAAGF